MSEINLLHKLLLWSSQRGLRLYRNNVGCLKNERGGYVTYGLCTGSSDLIGWTPIVITPEMVGRTVAVFTAIETKFSTRGTTPAQARFLKVVHEHGGIATVARNIDDAQLAIERFTCDR